MSAKKSLTLPLLGGLLAIQLVIAAVVWQSGAQPEFKVEPLLNSAVQSVDGIVLSNEDESVALKKVRGQWQVYKNSSDHEDDGLPVENHRVTSLLETLSALKTGWPLATTLPAQKRFEVARDAFARKVVILKEGQEQDVVYFGISVSLKKVHVRRAGSENIFGAEFNVYDAPTNVNAWLDTTLLQPVGALKSITVNGVKTHKHNDLWPGETPPESSQQAGGDELDQAAESSDENADAQASTEGAEGKLDTETKLAVAIKPETPIQNPPPEPIAANLLNAQALEGALSNLRVIGVADSIPKADGDTVDTSFSVNVDHKELIFTFTKHKEQYFAARSDYEKAFKIAKSQYDNIVGYTSLKQAEGK